MSSEAPRHRQVEPVPIEGPLDTPAHLDELRTLYGELHRFHGDVASYGPLVQDPDRSWELRRALYEDAMLDEGAVYFVARGSSRTPVGYAFAVPTIGPDDTFETSGVVELVSLVVSAGRRGEGIGRRLVEAVERHASSLGADTVKIAVMAGNRSAESLYTELGYEPAEVLLYKQVAPADPA